MAPLGPCIHARGEETTLGASRGTTTGAHVARRRRRANGTCENHAGARALPRALALRATREAAVPHLLDSSTRPHVALVHQVAPSRKFDAHATGERGEGLLVVRSPRPRRTCGERGEAVQGRRYRVNGGRGPARPARRPCPARGERAVDGRSPAGWKHETRRSKLLRHTRGRSWTPQPG